MKNMQQLANQAQQQLQQPAAHSQTQAGQTKQSSLLVNAAFASLEVIFGRKFKTKYKTPDELTAAKRLFLRYFRRHGITQQQVNYALDQCVSQHIEWPPEIGEFINLCLQGEALGLPSIDVAKSQCLAGYHAQKYREQYQFSHPTVRWACEQIGHLGSTLTANEFDKRFKQTWKKAVLHHRLGTLPPPIAGHLPPPRPTVDSRAFEKSSDPLFERLRKIRDLTRQNRKKASA